MAEFTEDEIPSVKRPDDPAPDSRYVRADARNIRPRTHPDRLRGVDDCRFRLHRFHCAPVPPNRSPLRRSMVRERPAALNAGKLMRPSTIIGTPSSTSRMIDTFQFHLAQALARAGQEDESQTYLFNLALGIIPGSGPINLTLARIAVQLRTNSDAIRYYHNAIYGVWETHPISRRWEVRRELCEYLLNQEICRGRTRSDRPGAGNPSSDVAAKISPETCCFARVCGTAR